ncbi:MAG: FtsX-like permease family protein, partial [Anaerolineae bacterium]|nr:FtsX-like permease family protein [Anaerolineae bacterium]
DDLILTTLPTAQTLLEMPDTLSRIDLILPEGYDLQTIRAILPAGAVLTTPVDESSALSQMTDAFELNLQALSLLALVVGVFLIYNTVSFSVVQRRPVIGILRSLGTTRRQIFIMVVGEAFLLGTVGTLLGLGLGVLMGRGTVSAISQTISDLYFRVNVQEVTLDPIVLMKGLVIGIAASVFAAVIPALDAVSTAPAGVVRRSQVEQRAHKALPYITLFAGVLILVGFILLRVSDNSVFWSFAALFTVIVGCALFTPLALIITMHLIRPLTGQVFGVIGRMAPRAVLRSLSRTSIAVAALTLAVSTIVGVGVMIGSFRQTVEAWLENTIGADIFISPPSLTANRIVANVDPAIIETLDAVDGVQTVTYVRSVEVNAPDDPDLPPVRLAAISQDIAQGQRRFIWNKAQNGDYRAALREGFVAVTEPFAFHRGITEENNTITLLTDKGAQEFTVIGVYYDYGSDQGTLMMDIEVYRSYFDDPYITSLALYVEDDASIPQVMDQLRTETLIGMDLEVQSNRELREGALEIFDRTFSITAALQVLAVMVAFIGILSALMALQLEHQREYGIMRANGMTPGQIRQFTLVQTGLMGLTSGLLAIPVGTVLAFILIYVINVRSFGWSMNIAPVPQEFAQAMAVALFASITAGLYPAWRLSKIITASAIRGE